MRHYGHQLVSRFVCVLLLLKTAACGGQKQCYESAESNQKGKAVVRTGKLYLPRYLFIYSININFSSVLEKTQIFLIKVQRPDTSCNTGAFLLKQGKLQ